MQRLGFIELADTVARRNRVDRALDSPAEVKGLISALREDIENLALDLALAVEERLPREKNLAGVAERLLKRVAAVGTESPKKHGSRKRRDASGAKYER